MKPPTVERWRPLNALGCVAAKCTKSNPSPGTAFVSSSKKSWFTCRTRRAGVLLLRRVICTTPFTVRTRVTVPARATPCRAVVCIPLETTLPRAATECATVAPPPERIATGAGAADRAIPETPLCACEKGGKTANEPTTTPTITSMRFMAGTCGPNIRDSQSRHTERGVEPTLRMMRLSFNGFQSILWTLPAPSHATPGRSPASCWATFGSGLFKVAH